MFIAILFTAGAATRAQVAPATNGPAGPQVSGTLRYDLRYSQTAQFYGGPLGDVQSSVLSGDVTYASFNQARPFSLTYSGGDRWNISGSSENSGTFQHLMISQGFLRRKWAFRLSDDVSYMPQAPTTGFSGIPGVGSLPSVPSAPSQPILTLNTRSVNNTVSPSFTRSLDHATSLSLGVTYGILRFPDGNGLETNSLQTGPQITRRLNALNSISGQYSFSRFSYPDYIITMGTQSALFGYQRTWNRRFKTSVAAGPEWVQGFASAGIPSSTGLTANANASYETRSASAMLNYSQATSGGAGVATQIGVHNQDINTALTRQFGRNLSINAMGAYMRTQGLQQTGVTNGKYAGASATRRLGRYVTVSANYTAIQQSSSTALPTNAISGLSQVIGFGIGYSPKEMHFRK